MTDETLRAFIARRRRELENQLTAARSTVSTIEIQLTELDRAEKALPPAPPSDISALVAVFGPPHGNALDNIPRANANSLVEGALSLGQALIGPFDKMTIKQLVMKALRDHYPKALSTTELRSFIRDAHSSAVMRESPR